MKNVPLAIAMVPSETMDHFVWFFLNIHTTQFTVFGNITNDTDIDEIFLLIWGSIAYGNPMPLFGIRTTNGVEGENNALLHNDLRQMIVEKSLITYIDRYLSIQHSIKRRVLVKSSINLYAWDTSFGNRIHGRFQHHKDTIEAFF